MSREDNRGRSEPRVTFFSPIQFVTREEPGRFLKGVVNNISQSGMGIYSFDSLSEGQEIVVASTLPNAHNEYTVRWSRKLMDDFFMAGLRSADQE